MLLKHTSSGAEKTLKILRTVCQNGNYRFTGKFKKDGKQLFLPLNDGLLEILELQLEGKKRMTAQDFLLGFPIDEWKILV